MGGGGGIKIVNLVLSYVKSVIDLMRECVVWE